MNYGAIYIRNKKLSIRLYILQIKPENDIYVSGFNKLYKSPVLEATTTNLVHSP